MEALGPAEVKLLAETFITLMTRFVHTWYYNPEKHYSDQYREKDYLKPFDLKMSVFSKVFGHFKDCMRLEMDTKSYKALMMSVGLAKCKYGEENLGNWQARFVKHQSFNTFLTISVDAKKEFDFYTDSNVSEVIECNQLLNKIEMRVKVLQEQWPENAILNDVSDYLVVNHDEH